MKFKIPAHNYREFPIEFRQQDVVEGETRQEGSTGLQREFDISFASEIPVERARYWEILDHSDRGLDLTRLNNGAPVLLHHNRNIPDFHVGTVENARRADGVSRAGIRLASDGVTEEADKAVRKVNDRILTKVSVGYELLDFEDTEEELDGKPILRFSWRPFEISLLPIAADDDVGVYREYEDTFLHIEVKDMPDKTEDTKQEVTPQVREPNTPQLIQREPEPKKPEIDIQAVRTKFADDEKKRITDIQAIRSRYHDNKELRETCDVAIREGYTVEQVHSDIIGRGLLDNSGHTMIDDPSGYVGLDERQLMEYNLSGVVEATVSRNFKGFEMEVEASNHIAEVMGRAPKGVYIPLEILARHSQTILETRAKNLAALNMRNGYFGGIPTFERAPPMTTTTGAAGLLGTMHMSNMFIDALRPFTVSIPLGVRTLTGLQQNVSIPKLTASAPFEWVGEDDAGTDVEATTGTVPMSPKTITSHVPVSRLARIQSLPDLDAIMLNDMLQGAGIGIDKGVIQGTGTSNEMTGILNQSGVGTVPIGTPGSAPTEGQPTWPDILKFEEAVSLANADGFNMAYLTSIHVRTHGKGTEKFSNTGERIWESNNTMNGYPAVASNQQVTYKTLYGDFAQAIVGFWGTLDVMIDPYTRASRGGTVYRVFQSADTAVRHGVAFAKSVLATP